MKNPPKKANLQKKETQSHPATKNHQKEDYFSFLKRYSTKDECMQKERYQKVKVTSLDKFEDTLHQITKQVKKQKSQTPFLFCGIIDGVDEILSAYSKLASSFPQKKRNEVYSIFTDINPYKIDYFTFRLFLTQISDSPISYMRNLMYYDTEYQKISEKISFLENAHRQNPESEQHKNYLIAKIKEEDSLGEKAKKELRQYVNKGVDILNLIKHSKRNYKSLANMLKINMLLNPETHWLMNEEHYQIIREAVKNNLIRIFQGDLNSGGKIQLLKIIKDNELPANIIYAPKNKQKFSEADDLIQLFDHVIDTALPSKKTGKYKEWTISEPERFFMKPEFAHHGELSSEKVMELSREYKERCEIDVKSEDEANVLLVGDVPFGRAYMDARSMTFLKNLQKYANFKKIPHVVLCGDVLDGEHTREKRKLAILQYLSEAPTPTLEQQCELAVNYLHNFDGKLYTVASDGDWDIIEEKQRELINHKEFEYRIESNTRHIPDDVRKSLRVEAIFESAKAYYDYVESNIKLSARIGDKLNIDFPQGIFHISHMGLGQYFRRSLTRSVGVKEQLLINQFTVCGMIDDPEKTTVKVSSHDNVLQAHMESNSCLNLKIPSLESPDKYDTLPIQLRSAVQDMMHKAFAVRGKIPFPGSCHVKITNDHRIYLTILNERVMEILKAHQAEKKNLQFMIFDIADAQIGSIAYNHKMLIKYLDYIKCLSEKMNKDPNMDARRIALFNGDVIEGINYPTAMMRNAPTKLVIPETQISYATEVLKPFFLSRSYEGLFLDDDIEKIVLTHGNHEVNSGFKYSGLVATHSLYQYFKGHVDRKLSYKDAREKLVYSLFTRLDKDRLLFSSMGAFSCLGLNVHCIHSYGRRPNIASAHPTQERWISNLGELAKKWDILIQGHYHKFSVGECAGKILITFPSFAEISDFEYERGLDSPPCRIIIHISTKDGIVIEVLTKKFMDNYKCQHPMFKKITVEEFHERCTERALEPLDVSKL